jgi:hypothetical protein
VTLQPVQKTAAERLAADGSTAKPVQNGTLPRARKRRWVKAFLAALAETGIVTRACKVARVGRMTVYRNRQENPEFAAAWQEAQEVAADNLEAEARRRAVEGTRRYKFTPRGEPVMDPRTGEQYYEHEYSDKLLIQLLKAKRPEEYRERTEQRHTGPDCGPIQDIEVVNPDTLPNSPGEPG